jgi:hypothetical protein
VTAREKEFSVIAREKLSVTAREKEFSVIAREKSFSDPGVVEPVVVASSLSKKTILAGSSALTGDIWHRTPSTDLRPQIPESRIGTAMGWAFMSPYGVRSAVLFLQEDGLFAGHGVCMSMLGCTAKRKRIGRTLA